MADLKSMKMSEKDRRLIEDAESLLGPEPSSMGFVKNLFWGNLRNELVFPYPTQDAKEVAECDQLLARRVDALVVASARGTREALGRIEEQKIPYVLIDRQFAGAGANFVGVDDEAVGDLATTHLIEIGCRRIAHIRGPEVSTAIGRLEGYRRARPLTAAELGALPLLARGSALRFLLTRLFDWLNQPAGALVRPKDPLEFLRKLRFHRGITDIAGYGLDA